MPDLLATLDAALAGGIKLFQYRDKRGCDADLLRTLHRRTQHAHALLLVNDEPELAAIADGIHLGQEDLTRISLAQLRRQHPTTIIGVSAHTIEQVAACPQADYYGVGPLHPTNSKQVARAPLGIDGIASIARFSAKPVCAIGGITRSDLAPLRAQGVAMAAVIGSIAHASNQTAAARELVEGWETHK